MTLRLGIPSSGTRDCGESETDSLSHRMQAGPKGMSCGQRTGESRGRSFRRRGKGLRFESVSEEIGCNLETWRQTSWGMPGKGHIVSREWSRDPQMGIGEQASSRQPQGHQDGLVLEKTTGRELLKTI